MIETIEYKGSIYPLLVTGWNAAQYAIPFAKHFCKGIGFDIGTHKPEWAFPDSMPIDPELNEWDAMNLPIIRNSGGDTLPIDYIFSSQCLEHIPDYVAALDYWAKCLKSGGALFLYLPNMDANPYWRPQNNRRHYHYINPHIIESYFEDRQTVWRKVIVTKGHDLNFSFYAIAEKI